MNLNISNVGRGALMIALLTTSACSGGDDTPDKSSFVGASGSATGEGVDYSFGSLDVSSLAIQSNSWCEAPSFRPTGFATLDKDAFGALLADYTVDWMTPLHEGIGALDEAGLFNATFEMIFSTFMLDCNWNQPGDLVFEDDELTEEETRADARAEVLKAIDEAVEISSGETLRLSFHPQCDDCDEPAGKDPFFVNAQLTNDGVLVMQIELAEGKASTQKFIITPDAIVVEADLASYSQWLSESSSDTRSGDIVIPNVTGTITSISRKEEGGGISSTLGISGYTLDTRPGESDSITATANARCMGMHAAIDSRTGGAQVAAQLGDLTVTVPGSVHCDSASCGDKESTQDWVYSLGGVSIAVEQPGDDSENELRLNVQAETSSKASLGGDVFAEGGPGVDGKGGTLGLEVDTGPEGHLVTFQPALNLGGAMTISNFSDRFRLDLPDWLQDEIFDVTFGGDPTASVFVPARAQCNDDSVNPDGMDPPEPQRRELRVRSGALEATTGSGLKTAVAEQCVGGTLADESSLSLTSDWVEVGFDCK